MGTISSLLTKEVLQDGFLAELQKVLISIYAYCNRADSYTKLQLIVFVYYKKEHFEKIIPENSYNF